MSTAIPFDYSDAAVRFFQRINLLVTKPAQASRFLLWVDAVGGFLVCLGDKVSFGQAVPGNSVEVPLLADVSRHHATIRRDGEGYLIEPTREVWLNGRKLDRVTGLSDGALIQMGSALQLQFRRPHPLSATARLDFISHHRTQPLATAILLMADTCLLGPGRNSHVVCRDWPEEVVLHRKQQQLFCRARGPLEIDGRTSRAGGPLSLNSQIRGDHFSFGLESI